MSDTTLHTAAFVFRVSIEGIADPLMAQEVTGLDTALETEPVTEGGENRFAHKLPPTPKHPNIILRHLSLTSAGPAVAWVRSTLEGDLAAPIMPKTVTIEMVNAENTPYAAWTLTNAYPVKWRVGHLDATTSDIAVESLELAFDTLTRS